MAGRLTSGKQLVKAVFNAAGLEIRKRRPAEKAGVPRARLEGALRQLGRLGFEPRTVIDVGVAYATSELYEQFPGAQILLVEPLAEFEPFLQRIAGKYNAQYVLAGRWRGSGDSDAERTPGQVWIEFAKRSGRVTCRWDRAERAGGDAR
jgi:hypothetical protein